MKKDGFYTIEGAFTIVIFTALFMMLLSLITLVRLETVIQSALNESALEISQFSYGVLKSEEHAASNNLEFCEELSKILSSENRPYAGNAAGAAICRELFKGNIDVDDYDNWLKKQGVEGGFKGLSFDSSNVLGSGSNVNAVVTYTVKVNTYGLFDKSLKIRQCANTRAWLPAGVSDLLKGRQSDENSIWSKDPLVRGRYFVAKIKAENKDAAVLSGQGVDLFYKTERKAVEIFSMNPYCTSYSEEDFLTFKEESILKQLEEYAKRFESDLKRAQRLFKMEDGSLGNYGVLNEKEILLVLPKEAGDSAEFGMVFENIKQEIMKKYSISLKAEYREEAFL